MRRNTFLLLLLSALGVVASTNAISATNTYPLRFGAPFYTGFSDSTIAHFPSRTELTSARRATLNLRQSVDLFTWDPLYFTPDLGSPGRETVISYLGQGADWTKAIWRGRPLRDPRTGRANLTFIHPASIGAVATDGNSAITGLGRPTLLIDPVDVVTNDPLTALNHRESYYGFMPVEFVHARGISNHNGLTLGGLFPRSTGRFLPHSSYGGQILWFEWAKRPASGNNLNISFQDGLHKIESPIDSFRTDVFRRDLDITYATKVADAKVLLRGYRAESTTKRGVWGDYGREVGGIVEARQNNWSSNLRITRLDGWLPQGNGYDLTEVSGAVGGIKRTNNYEFSGSVGVGGYWASQLRPTMALQISHPFDSLTTIGINASQGVRAHSPEQMFARYGKDRFEEALDPVLNFYLDLPVRGSRLDPSIMRSVNLSGERKLPVGSLSVSALGWMEQNAASWQNEGDSVIAWLPSDDRTVFGWTAAYEFSKSYWRGGLKAVQLIEEKATLTEPKFRLFGETGWHRFFYNGRLETDVLLSTRYYPVFHNPAERPNEPMGGKVPVDIRFTGRISRFTFYYGIHNLNGVHYYLVPGYQAMHKEEYWGIDWLLFD